MTNPILKIALTGGIASGKSLIQSLLNAEGVPSIDADDIVHALLANDEELRKNIKTHFGKAVFFPDGTINRKALGDIVFQNIDERKKLESWIHPKTRIAIDTFFKQQAQAGKRLAVAVIPLLFESGLAEHYDIVWLVKADEAQQVTRLIQNRHLTEEDATRRIQNQLTFDEKLKRLQSCPKHAVINNTGSIEETEKQLKHLLAALMV